MSFRILSFEVKGLELAVSIGPTEFCSSVQKRL